MGSEGQSWQFIRKSGHERARLAELLVAEGVEDWVVLHGGATAIFRVGSMAEAARLAGAVAKVPQLDGSGALLTIADTGLTVRLTRDVWQLEPRHAELARAV